MAQLGITPFTITNTFNVTTLLIGNINIVLNTSARISYTFYSDSGKPVKSGVLELTGQDYQDWTTDDNYLITKILAANE